MYISPRIMIDLRHLETLSEPTILITEHKIKKEQSSISRDATPGGDMMTMGIAEKIKSEGRTRKAPSVAPSSDRGTPAPTPISKASSPGLPRPPKAAKPPKKKGTAAPVKKSTQKKSKVEGMLRSLCSSYEIAS